MTPEQLEKIRKLCDKNFKVGTHPKTICIDEMIYLGGCAGGMLDLIDQQAEEIKRLEDALVEERARRLVAAGAECFFRTPIKGSILSKCDKGIYCDWTTCPIKDEKRQDAREQLRAEGVIG